MDTSFDVIVVGGSYAGLSAALALGRALRKVLVIDSGQPCNRFTPHSHNFITQDGQTPQAIAAAARAQVQQYPTVQFLDGLAMVGEQTAAGFRIQTETGQAFDTRRLIFATGVRDLLPDLPGFAECWGKTVIHCPYCHGYEVRGEPTGILANGDMGFHYAQLIHNWTQDLTLLTNGPATFSAEQASQLAARSVRVVEAELAALQHEQGRLQEVQFADGSRLALRALYARPPQKQHCDIPASLGCELTEQGLLHVDVMQKTNVAGVFACGDNTTMMRSVANAVGAGNMAGAAANNDMLTEDFVATSGG